MRERGAGNEPLGNPHPDPLPSITKGEGDRAIKLAGEPLRWASRLNERGAKKHWQRVASGTLCIAVALLAGCERPADEHGERQAGSAQAAKLNEPVWKQVREATVAEVSEPAALERLEAARKKAVESLDQARLRWQNSPESERAKWSVKWAAVVGAPVEAEASSAADGGITIDAAASDGVVPTEGVEHVWVVPVNWSAFRVEGVIANAPTRPLACGKGQGEIVSFSASEVTDWMFLPSGRFEDGYEGGYSIEALEGTAE